LRSEINVVANLKRVLDQTYLSLRFHDDFDNVEPIGDFSVIEQAEPFFRRPDDSVLLSKGDSLVGIAKEIGRSRLDLDKYQDFCPPITADQIDFASSLGSEITEEDFVARFPQEADGYLLAALAQADMGGG
jgi:hypothetical protein